VAAVGNRVGQGGLGVGAGGVAAQGLEAAGAVGLPGSSSLGCQRMHRLEHVPAVLGWALTHLRWRLPRLFIAAGWQRAGGGEQGHQGLFGMRMLRPMRIAPSSPRATAW
jgi:hypothetical protein